MFALLVGGEGSRRLVQVQRPVVPLARVHGVREEGRELADHARVLSLVYGFPESVREPGGLADVDPPGRRELHPKLAGEGCPAARWVLLDGPRNDRAQAAFGPYLAACHYLGLLHGTGVFMFFHVSVSVHPRDHSDGVERSVTLLHLTC